MIRLLLLLAVAAGPAAAQRLQVTAELPSELVAGDENLVPFEIRLEDGDGILERGVLFLNVVVNSRERRYPQAAHLVFARASEQPGVFRHVYTLEELQAGIETVIGFHVRDRAPPDDYALVIQLYSGDQTNPHRVRAEERVAQASFNFRVVAANADDVGDR